MVIPTLGEWSLPYCVESVRRHIPVNRVILVGPSNDDKLSMLADVFVPFDEKNVGRARARGLEQVKTEYYASVDSDVLVNSEWSRWCLETIQRDDVGACQGYAKPIAKIYGSLDEQFIKRGGLWGKGLCGLANTLLRTSVVKEVGMPQIPVHEDWALLLRIEQEGYEWISNMDVITDHLITDVDIWKHHILWSKKGAVRPIFQIYGQSSEASKLGFLYQVIKRAPILSHLYQIGYYSTIGLLKHPLNENLFEIACRLFMVYGFFAKPLRRKSISGARAQASFCSS